MVDNKKLRELYRGDFSKRKRFDDGGSAYVSYGNSGLPDPGTQYLTPDMLNQGSMQNLSTLGAENQQGYDQELAQLGGEIPGGSSSGGGSSAGTGALAKLLGLSGTSASGLAALAGLAGLAGAFTQNKSNPTIAYNPPPLFGGQAGTTGGNAGGVTTGYGPAGGYNHANYAGLTAKSPQAGLGYTPRTAISPSIPNYYTYGQGPQQSFFSGAAGHKNGGLIKKYTRGGSTTPQRFDGGGPVAPQPGITGQPMPQQQPAGLGGGAIPAYNPMGSATAPAGIGPQIGGVPTPAPQSAPAPVPAPNPAQQQAQQQRLAAIGAAQQALHQSNMAGNTQAQGAQMYTNMMQRPQTGGGLMGGAVPKPAPGVNPNPMLGHRPMMPTIMRRAEGGQASVVTSNTAPLSQAFPQRSHWAGPTTQDPASAGHADGGPLSTVSRHVVGPGDGTSDDIPARLANGEYVMDAQTVSMAGNGSNDAGAKKLDQFRAALRKHKGAALAKGKMAPDAHKNLMKYMGKK